MKVLIINGSPRMNGNTSIALNEMVKIFEKEGVETEVVQIGSKDVRGCTMNTACLSPDYRNSYKEKNASIRINLILS